MNDSDPFADEKWLPVVGYDPYEVSDHGRVRRNGKILKPQLSVQHNRPPGHLKVGLSINGHVSLHAIHILVLTTFAGPRPEGHQGLHKDDVKTNNHLSNLYWGTPSQNMHDRVRNGLHSMANRTHCQNCGEILQHIGKQRACLSCLRKSKRAWADRSRPEKLIRQ